MSAEQETRLFFENLIREDRSILDFLDADYTFVNEYLAEFYGLHDVKGPEFRRVSLASTPRRGVLGQASVLTATSYPDRTSVVLRGKWILENLLNAPPPPPPPNVPNLEDGAGWRARHAAAAHGARIARTPVCASCHAKMDPHRVRTGELRRDRLVARERRVRRRSTRRHPAGRRRRSTARSSSSACCDRRATRSCRALSEEHVDLRARARASRPSDRAGRQEDRCAASRRPDYRFSSVVLEIVKSLPFQMRKADKGHI